MRQRYDFIDAAYRSRPLREPVAGALGRLGAKLSQGRVVPISGSGLSAGAPTGLPSGAALGVMLRQWAESKGLGATISALASPDDLGEVAEAVEAALGRDVLLTELLRMVLWRRARFNLGHLAIALMFAEGWITIGFTTNWDLLVLDAADTLDAADLPCPCNIPTLQVSTPPMHVHLHGSVDAPDTLVATTTDLSRPGALDWSEPQLRGVLTMGEPMLVGFAVEPDYIVSTLEELLNVMGAPPAAVISLDSQADFIAKSPRLASATNLTATSGPYVSGSATESLGDVVRSTYAEKLGLVLREAERRALQAVATPAALSPAGVGLVGDVLLGSSLADFLALLWRGAVLATDDVSALQPTLVGTEDDLADALAVLMILCSSGDVSGIEVQGEALRISYAAGLLDVWVVVPPQRSQITRIVRAAYLASSHFTRPGDDAIPLLLLCARTFGRPPPGGPVTLLSPGTALATSGRLTMPQRQPVDVLTLDDVDERCRSFAGTPPHQLSDIARL
jgi:hypothetical protein